MGLFLGHTKINALNPYIIVKGESGSVTRKDVNFIANGKIVKSYTLQEARNLTQLPEVPYQEYLTPDGWNYTLAQVQSLQNKADIGAQYKSSDGDTKIFISIPEKGRLKFRLHCSCSVSRGAVITWGDNWTTTITSTSPVDHLHDYSSAGNYIISIHVTSGTLTLGRNNSSYNICGSTSQSTSNPIRGYSDCIKSVIIGNSVTSIDSLCFYQCSSLQSITIPNSVTSIGSYCFQECYSLQSITIPNSVTSIGSYCFCGCYSLQSITIPNSVTSIGSYCFYWCYSLKTTDFHTHTSIPSLASTNVYSYTADDLEIVVPDNLYDTWITATNWSDASIKSKIVKYSESSIYEG